MRKITLLITAIVIATTAIALPVSHDRANAIANHIWQTVLHGRGTVKSVEWQYPWVYLFVGENGGYVMLSADDCARPLIAYSPNETLDPTHLPVQLQARMEVYSELIKEAVEASPADAARWSRLDNAISGSTETMQDPKTENLPAKDGDDRIGPLLQTHWHQDGAYALLTPQHTPTGCAATAQAQFMRYWNYPPFGNGNETYNCQPYGAQSADFAHTRYEWDKMPEQVTTSSPQEQQMAVSTLMYHVGVSLHMGYADGGSGAAGLAGRPGVASIDNSLQDYFHYSRQMRAIFRTSQGWTDQSWTDTLVAELRLLHPVIYCGVAPEGGHGFVCDGYERRTGDVYFHFNFGWSGNGDGYYTVDDICPNVSPTGEVGSAYHFNQSNQALLGAVPDYGLHVSDSIVTFTRDGGDHSLLFCSDERSLLPWSVSSDQSWVVVDTAIHDGALTVTASANSTGMERQATLTFTQGDKHLHVSVVQTYYSEEEYCPLTVVMESTTNGGWENGAYLGFESPSGYVYNTATLAHGGYDSVQVGVPPHDVNIVFHHGGGTDRYINYRIYNSHGELLTRVDYAFMNGGTDYVEWPCAHLSINPNESDPQVLYTEIYDLTGRLVHRHMHPQSSLLSDTERQATESLLQLPHARGVYLLRIVTDRGVTTKKMCITH